MVEALIPAPVELVWQRSQDPVLHVAWDIRFTRIAYLTEKDERGYHLMDYRTAVAFGVEVKGVGRYLHTTPLRHSTFEASAAPRSETIPRAGSRADKNSARIASLA